MKKIYQIVFYYRRVGDAIAYKSKILFENYENAQLIAHLICKQKKLYFKLIEFYI